MKKRILIVTEYYYPDIAANVGLIKDLAEYIGQYFDITVITNEIRGATALVGDTQSNNELIPISVIRKRNPFVRRRGLLSKILEYGTFIFTVTIYLKNRSNHFSAIFCQSTPPLMSIPIRSVVNEKSKIVYNVQDLFPDSLIPYFSEHPYRILRRLEKASYNAADIVVTICTDFYNKINPLTHSDIKVIPNWVDTDELTYVPKEKNRIYKVLKEIDWSKKSIVYSGNIGINQDFDTVISVAKEFADCNFIIIGNGKKRPEVLRKVKALGISNFYFYDPFPKEWISDVYSFGDLYLLPMRENAMKASFPSKTWSILACGSPLVASVDLGSSFAKELIQNDLAYVCEPQNSNDLSSTICLALHDGRANSIKRIKYVRDNYSKEKLLQKYNDVFQLASQ
jgi:glycosyltransferase involved in cell wall biosynthesis